jgi:hypothetical protein
MPNQAGPLAFSNPSEARLPVAQNRKDHPKFVPAHFHIQKNAPATLPL